MRREPEEEARTDQIPSGDDTRMMARSNWTDDGDDDETNGDGQPRPFDRLISPVYSPMDRGTEGSAMHHPGFILAIHTEKEKE